MAVSPLLSTLDCLLLGREARLRVPLVRTLTAAGVLLFCLLVQAHSVWAGYASGADAARLSAYVLLGQAAFYVALRTGLTLALRDPALTMAQMVFALSALAVGYRINPHLRGVLLIVVPLVLNFGAFTLSPRHCRALGWLAVGLFTAAMAWGVVREPQRIDLTIECIHFLFVATVLPTISMLSGQLSRWRHDVQVQKRELRQALERLRLLATHDELTGLPNRHHVQEWVRTVASARATAQAPCCVALIDLDHFKRINDRLGHAAGDQVLRLFARAASRVLRQRDMLARWGGEEFLLVMPDTDPAEAEAAIARLRTHLAQPRVWADCPEARVTFSAGLAVHGPGQAFDDVLRQADAALYAAKHAGRDRIKRADLA